MSAALHEGAAASILELLPDPVLLLTLGAAGPEIAYGNQAAREVFRMELVGSPIGAALRRPEVLEAIDKAFEVDLPQEVSFETIGVQRRFWRTLAQPLPGEGGTRQLLLLLRDETNVRRTERMRADFLANASHELRTPLASLAGFVDTLRAHAKDDPEARDRFLGIMAQQAGRMARLIDDLLSLSRIELNEHIMPEGTVEMGSLLSEVAEAIRPIADERGVAVEVEGQAEPALVTGDRDQLVQVVQNLIDNAVKYSAPGETVKLRLETAASLDAARAPTRDEAVSLSLLSPDPGPPDQAYAVVRIADSGPGIARQHLPRLSERFYRVDGQKERGTGLGLAIVKHVVNRHRGGVTVESAEGQGTTFSVYLPAAP